MLRTVAGFDRDRGNLTKCVRHGVSIAEIEQLFHGTVMVRRDDGHSSLIEQRYLAIGRTVLRRYVFVAFALRKRGEKTFIRPISARYMHRKEIDYYEKEDSGS